MNTDCIDYNEEQLNALVEDIMKIHDFLIKEQGLNAARPESRAKISSAAYACFVSKYGLPFNETHNYNDIYDQVSDFAYHLALDHPFADANKRTTVMTTLVLLYINGINIEFNDSRIITHNKLYKWIQDLVQRNKTRQELAQELRENSTPLTTN